MEQLHTPSTASTVSTTSSSAADGHAPSGLLASIASWSPERRLRLLLTANATSSMAVAVAGLAAAGWWSEQLGVDSPTWVRAVCAPLLVFAAAVLWLSRSDTTRLRTGALWVSVADFVWVAASAAVVAAGVLNGWGVALVVVMAVAVLDYGLLQLRFRQQMSA